MKKVAIPDPRDRRFSAQDPGFKLLFGLKVTDKWPIAGIENEDGSTKNVFVEGDYGRVNLWVDPLRRGQYKGHRLMCRCPVCGGVMSAGRLQQHVRIHEEVA
jgi:hypothetical protein